MIQQNRKAVIEVQKAPPEDRKGMKKIRGTPSGLAQPADSVPGTKAFRKMIIEEKPSKKKLKEHLEGLIAFECESSSDEE